MGFCHSLSEQDPEASRQSAWLVTAPVSLLCKWTVVASQLDILAAPISLLRVRSHRSDSGRQSAWHTGGASQLATTLVNHDIQHLFAMPAVHQNKFLLKRCSAASQLDNWGCRPCPSLAGSVSGRLQAYYHCCTYCFVFILDRSDGYVSYKNKYSVGEWVIALPMINDKTK